MADVESHNQRLGQLLRDALAQRREQLGQATQQIQKLGLPVRKRASAIQAEPILGGERAVRETPRGAAKDYDVAFSFAGEDRDYVEQVAALLQASAIKVFYDKFKTVQSSS